MGKSLEVSNLLRWTLTKRRKNSVHFSRKASSMSSKLDEGDSAPSFVNRCKKQGLKFIIAVSFWGGRGGRWVP